MQGVMKMKYSDTELLDWLQSKLGSYTGKVICRFSCYGRGWRLHETSIAGAVDDVRLAINDAIDKEKKDASS
jgi:hypothetical protein